MTIVPSHSGQPPDAKPGPGKKPPPGGSPLEPEGGRDNSWDKVDAVAGLSQQREGNCRQPGGQPRLKSGRSEVLSASQSASDGKVEQSLRPPTLSQYTGQSRLKSMLEMSIVASRRRGEPLDHVLLYGPPGLGKTTLAGVIANEMGSRLHMTSAPSLERPRDIIGLVHQLEAGDVLFIDEIHRLSRVAEELLYPAIEDFVIDLSSGKGHATRTMRLPLPRFTLIGATTKAGMLSNALRDRFGFVCRLEFYSLEELSVIVRRTAGILGVSLDDQAVGVIAARGRGTPRIANRLVRLVRDFAQYRWHLSSAPDRPTAAGPAQNLDKESAPPDPASSFISAALAAEALDTYQVDGSGLDPTDRQLLGVLIGNYGGGPVGIETLAATIGEDSDTVEDVYEPFLIQCGFIQRTPRGRVATPAAYKHLQCPPPARQLPLDMPMQTAGGFGAGVDPDDDSSLLGQGSPAGGTL